MLLSIGYHTIQNPKHFLWKWWSMRLGFFSKMNHTMHQRFDLQNPEVLNVHDFLNSQTPKRYVWYSIYIYINILSYNILYKYYIFWFCIYIYILYYLFISIFEIPVTWTVTLPARFAPCGRLWGCPPPRVKFIVMRMLSDPFSLNSFEDMMIVWRRILALNKWTLITFFGH